LQGRAREAMAFYHKVLGGNLDLQALRLEADGGQHRQAAECYDS
jgi:uncharacterized glyoxalase superfamily protein PhnB